MTTKSVMRRFALFLALFTVGVGQPMLQLYGSNLAVFTSADITGTAVVVFGFLVLLVPPLFMLLLDVASDALPRGVRNVVRHGLVALAAVPFGMLLVRSLDLAWPLALVLAACPAMVVAVLHARSSSVRSWLTWTSALGPVVLAMFVVSAQSVIREPAAAMVSVATTVAPSGNDVSNVPATKPEDVSVLWLQLDEAPLWPLLGTDGNINARRFPGFAALAQNSTWFRNTLGVSQTTVDAVPSMLTGKTPVTGKAPTYSNYRKNLFALMYKRRAFDVHEMATALCPKEACATVSVSGGDDIANGGGSGVETTTTTSSPAPDEEKVVPAARRADYRLFFRDVMVVLGHKLLPTGLRSRLPVIDEGWGGFGANNVDVESSELTSPDTTSPAPVPTPTLPRIGGTTLPKKFSDTVVESKKNTVRRWEADGAKSQVPVAEDMIARAARSAIPTLHFAHVLLPHRPWQLTPDMRTTRFVSTDKRDATVEDRVRDEYQAFLAQYVATDAIVLKLVTDMKKSANWDRTMIIVTADHGLAFEPGESKRKDINPERTDTLEEIYRTPLFVKFPDQKAPAVNDCPTHGFDVMPMVVNATGLDAGWDFDGVDVTKSCPSRPVRTIWWNKGKTTLTSDRMAAVTSARRFDRWVDADGDVDAIARPTGYEGWFDVNVPATAPRDSTVRRWTNRDISSFRLVGDGTFAATPMQFDGTIVAGAPTAGAVGLVAMDGRVVAVIPELAEMQPGTNTYRSMVLPSALTPGRHDPVLYVARGTPESATLTLVGPPG